MKTKTILLTSVLFNLLLIGIVAGRFFLPTPGAQVLEDSPEPHPVTTRRGTTDIPTPSFSQPSAPSLQSKFPVASFAPDTSQQSHPGSFPSSSDAATSGLTQAFSSPQAPSTGSIPPAQNNESLDSPAGSTQLRSPHLSSTTAQPSSYSSGGSITEAPSTETAQSIGTPGLDPIDPSVEGNYLISDGQKVAVEGLTFGEDGGSSLELAITPDNSTTPVTRKGYTHEQEMFRLKWGVSAYQQAQALATSTTNGN